MSLLLEKYTLNYVQQRLSSIHNNTNKRMMIAKLGTKFKAAWPLLNLLMHVFAWHYELRMQIRRCMSNQHTFYFIYVGSGFWKIARYFQWMEKIILMKFFCCDSLFRIVWLAIKTWSIVTGLVVEESTFETSNTSVRSSLVDCFISSW